MDPITDLVNALGADLLRAKLTGREPPRLRNRYIMRKILGRGASGVVIDALDDRLGRPVALKLRPSDGDLSVLAEARAMARLDHPNIVRVHDVDLMRTTIDGRSFELWFVCMTLVEGRTMRAWLREVPRSPEEVAGVCIDVARGLAAAHAERLVHRDVKPENVIVRPDGVAQVLDFGFAVSAGATQVGSAVGAVPAGTGPYMAPEARLGQTSRKSDQYALGITLVEGLTGSPLPAGRRAPDGVPAALWAIARTATAASREERFPDMRAMLDALTRATRPRPFEPPPRTLALIAAFALGGGALVAAAVYAPRPSAEATVATIPAQGSPRPALVATGDAPAAHDAPATDDALGAPTPAEVSSDAPTDQRARGGADDPSALEEPPPADARGLVDAPSPTALPPPASCPRLEGGVRTFLTRRTEGGSAASANQGRYRLGLDVRRGTLRDVSLRRPGDTLEVHSFRYHDCTLTLEASTDHGRRYRFELRIEGDAVRGSFEARNDPRQPDYRGVVEPSS